MSGLTKVCHFLKTPIPLMKLSPHYISWHSLVFHGTNRDEETSWWQVWQVGDCAIELSGSGIVLLNDRRLSGNAAQIFLLPQSSPSLSNLLNCRSHWWLNTSKNIDSRTITEPYSLHLPPLSLPHYSLPWSLTLTFMHVQTILMTLVEHYKTP